MLNNILISEDGSILEPNVHDGRIIGLFTLENKKLLLPILTANKSFICIALNDLECLRVDDFREGNIILDITVSSGTDVEIADIAYAHGLEQLTYSEANPYLNKAVQNFITGKKIFVQINPSYGCKLVCICGSAEVLQDWIPIISEYGKSSTSGLVV